jgi:prolyl oligopeptidase
MKIISIFIMASILHLQGFSQFIYPATKLVDSSDVFWGVEYKDPYRWLENLESDETAKWYKEQADFTNSFLKKITGVDDLINEYKVLDNIFPYKIEDRYCKNGRYFYKKTLPEEKVAKLYYREGLNGAEIKLFDPTTYVAGKTLSIQGILPSYDGKRIAIWFSEGGGEVCTIKIIDIDTKEILADNFPQSIVGVTSWSLDNKGITYLAHKIDDFRSPEFLLDTKIKYHIIGDNSKNDIDFFSIESYPNLGFDRGEIPFTEFNESSKKYVFSNLLSSRTDMYTFYAPIESDYSKFKWKLLCNPADKITRSRIIIGDDVYAICSKNATKFKLVHTTLLNPDWDKAEIIIPEKKDKSLENMIRCKDFLILSYSNGINSSLYKYNLKTKVATEIKMPFEGSAYILSVDNSANNCFVGISSWIQPTREFQFNAETDLFSPSLFKAQPNYPKDYSNLVVEEIEVKGHDGVMIPLSLIYKKGLIKNGKNVCFMDGYGAYGISKVPNFNTRLLPLAVKYDIIIAVSHIRGGSEKGEEWHMGGFKKTKPNSWKDFNSCAEYLISKGFTSKGKLIACGTSAGGLMISRAITERPDLYGSAICNVGTANVLRLESIPSGAINVPEFGTVKDSLECLWLAEMDALRHVKDGTKYPAVICVGGWNDPRVPAWQPAKFAAALQKASASNKPVFMKVNYDNGHFTEDKEVSFRNFAEQYAFALWQCDHPDFKLKKTP